ncbi:hypothetical protein Tco_0618753 [Tanacetum coccineum]
MKATMAWRCRACDDLVKDYLCVPFEEGVPVETAGSGAMTIIMVKKTPPDHVDDVPVVEPNQHDDVLVVPEPIIEDEDEDPEEDEFEEEKDPQEEEDDMEVDIEEDKNEPEFTYPYEEVNPLNPPPPVSESEPDDEIEVENPIEHEDETILVSVYEVGESSTAAIPREDGDSLLPGFKTIVWTRGGACISREEGEKQKISFMNERVERDLYWTRVRAHKFYQEMIRKGFVLEERPIEAINVPVQDEEHTPKES